MVIIYNVEKKYLNLSHTAGQVINNVHLISVNVYHLYVYLSLYIHTHALSLFLVRNFHFH